VDGRNVVGGAYDGLDASRADVRDVTNEPDAEQGIDLGSFHWNRWEGWYDEWDGCWRRDGTGN
jgi:hypothetical protein